MLMTSSSLAMTLMVFFASSLTSTISFRPRTWVRSGTSRALKLPNPHLAVISQRKYAIDILTETSMLDCRPSDTLVDPNVKLFFLESKDIYILIKKVPELLQDTSS